MTPEEEEKLKKGIQTNEPATSTGSGSKQSDWDKLNDQVGDSNPSDIKVAGGAGEWIQNSKVQSGNTATSGGFNHAEQQTKIDIDSDGENFQPVALDYAPGKFKFNGDDPDGLLAQISRYSKKPEWDAGREDRLKRVARVNALGDLMKHLGAFAGGGYAPVEKRQENKATLRAFQELDRMRELYDARNDSYNDKQVGYLLNAHNAGLQKHSFDENIKFQAAKLNNEQQIKSREKKAAIETTNGTTQISNSESGSKNSSNGWQNGSKNMESSKVGGSGSGKDMVRVYLGPNETVSIPKSTLENRMNLKSIFDGIKQYVPDIEWPKGKPIYGYVKDDKGNYIEKTNGEYVKDVVGYEAPSSEQIFETITTAARENPKAKNILMNLSGIEVENFQGGQSHPSTRPKSGEVPFPNAPLPSSAVPSPGNGPTSEEEDPDSQYEVQ